MCNILNEKIPFCDRSKQHGILHFEGERNA